MVGMMGTSVRQWLSRTWRVVGHTGVRPLTEGDPRSIVATNQFAMLSGITILCYSLTMLVVQWPRLVSPALVMLFLVTGWMLCIVLNGRGLFVLASSLALLLPIAVLMHLTMFFTTESGFHYLIFAGGALTFTLFGSDQWLLRVVFIVISVSAVVFCEAMFPSEAPRHVISSEVVAWLRALNIAFTVLLLYVVGRFDLHYYERERRKNAALLEAARVAAQTDSLTEVYNRRGVAPILSTVARKGEYSLALVDLDRFKVVNDRLGHGAGDVILANVARTLVRSIGDRGTVARWGGEEFLIVLPGMSLAEADALLEQVREDMEVEHRVSGSDVKVTVSVGLAHAPRYSGKEEVLRLADANLYEAKSSGRNLVVSARLVPQDA